MGYNLGMREAADILGAKRALVWRVIEKYLGQQEGWTGPEADYHRELVSVYPKRQGKYLRPTLVLSTAAAMGFPEKKALLTAAAMQTSEDWILIHDDIEDDSQERRGGPTLQRIYGRELAINAGDALHVLMWQMLWDNRKMVGGEKAVEVADEFGRILQRTVLGQTVELKWTRENRTDLTDEDVFFIIDGKTVYYSIAGPMRLGAILAGANERQLKAIYNFGEPLGRCFQIVDDLLDLTSDFGGRKKQQGNDIFEGKRTIMLMHLFRKAGGKDKRKLTEIMAKGREAKTKAEAAWVIGKMEEYGSLGYGRKLAEALAREARSKFRQELGFLNKQPARGELETLIEFVLNRDH